MASPGSVSADWLNWGLTNSQILGTESLPTIIEMETSPHARRFHRALRNFWAIWGSIGQGHGEYEMWRLKLLQHIDTRLPGPVASGRDVFLVCRSRITNGNIRIDAPSKHWSVYSQGHFYHLSAPTKPRRLWGMSQKSSANTHVDSQLKHEDLSNRETLDYQRLQSATIRPVPLIAYKVGQTHYSPNEIFSLAEWVMQRMSTYDLFTANCQVYALRLLARIVMRLSDRSSFVGTAIQIAEWDLQTESPHEGYKTIATGFHVHVPRPLTYTWLQALQLSFKDYIGDIRLILIEKAYQNGQTTYPDLSSTIRYVWAQRLRKWKAKMRLLEPGPAVDVELR